VSVEKNGLPVAGRYAHPLERVLQREGVDHRREHAHVVALRAVHALASAAQPAEDVAPADHEGDLHAGRVHVAELLRGCLQHGSVDARPTLLAAQGLAAEFDHDPFVARDLLFHAVAPTLPPVPEQPNSTGFPRAATPRPPHPPGLDGGAGP
jgi:hypothetical protein